MRRYGALLDVDLELQPTLAAQPELAFRIAGLFWSKNGLNELADEATAVAFKTITRRINGGLNGLADRQRFYSVACMALGVTPAESPRAPRRRSRRIEPPVFQRGAEAIRRAATPVIDTRARVGGHDDTRPTGE